MSNLETRRTRIAMSLAGIAFSVGLLASLPALAECVPQNFPNGWLQDQENAGGHTIAQHVGKTDAQLVNRYNTTNISGSSAYATNDAATQYIQGALAGQRAAYNAWEPNANIGNRRVVTIDAGVPVGRGIYHAQRQVTAADIHAENQVVAVIEKSANGVCFLLTSYPTP